MSAHSRRKGDAYELEVKKLFQAHDFDATKTGAYQRDDILVALNGHDLVCECKRRKRGFSGLYGFLEGADIVAHRDDRQETLFTMRASTFFALAENPITEGQA